MPSGAKKRKAAKKNKGNNRSNNHTHTSSASTHGHDYVKHQDHKETDVGEVSSPGSEDHHNHHGFSTEEMEKESNFPSLPSVEGSRSEVVANNIVLEKSVPGSEKEIKIEGVLYGEDARFKHDKAVRKSSDGGSSGSSSSSSSDNDIEDNQAQDDSLSERSVKTNHHVPVEEADDSVSKNIPAADSKKISVAPYVDESVINQNGERKLTSIENKVGGTSVALVDAVLEEEPIVQSVEKTEIVLGSKESLTQQNVDRRTSPQNAHSAATEDENNSGVNEPLLVPNPVQKTSWKSCCGLFEMFTGPRS